MQLSEAIFNSFIIQFINGPDWQNPFRIFVALPIGYFQLTTGQTKHCMLEGRHKACSFARKTTTFRGDEERRE